jgi:DNA-directed RNA polymerase sigma subunit (sigma70/sigma32)
MMMAGHLSVATIEALNNIVRTCRNLWQSLGREPTPEEIAERLRMPPETIRKLLGAPLTRHSTSVLHLLTLIPPTRPGR